MLDVKTREIAQREQKLMVKEKEFQKQKLVFSKKLKEDAEQIARDAELRIQKAQGNLTKKINLVERNVYTKL